jgi:hypothetical protein
MYQEKMERKRRKKEGRLTDWEKEMATLNAWNDLQKRRGKYACKVYGLKIPTKNYYETNL